MIRIVNQLTSSIKIIFVFATYLAKQQACIKSLHNTIARQVFRTAYFIHTGQGPHPCPAHYKSLSATRNKAKLRLTITINRTFQLNNFFTFFMTGMRKVGQLMRRCQKKSCNRIIKSSKGDFCNVAKFFGRDLLNFLLTLSFKENAFFFLSLICSELLL